jgi:choline dehydrogenase-like flavoprotein
MPWSADVVIVGSGVAGSLAASRLARAGANVLVLEAGPRVDRGAAYAQFRTALVKIPECPYPDAPHASRPRSDDLDHYFVQDGAVKFGGTYLRQVGGTTWHWLGTTLRLIPDDFRLRSRFGVGVDWPLSYDDLEPWYGEAERELGVAGDPHADLDAPRSQPYPLPPIPMSYADARTAAALAGRYSVQTTPQGRNSRPYDNRPACCGSRNCIPICPVQAKYDATVHVAQAERAGAHLVADAVVTRVDVGADGRISGVIVKRPDGSEDRATGKVFVIAAHGIETPKLLLQSRTERLPRGVGNSSDQVGRNLMDHPTQLTWGLAAESLGMCRGPQSTAGIESTRAGAWRADHGAFRLQLGNDGWSWPTGAPDTTVRELVGRGLRGAALDRALEAHAMREFNIAPLVEQLPDPGNRIVPDFERRDAIGVPRPRITYAIDEYSMKALAHARRIAREIGAALKATELHEGPEIMSSGHIIGTYRMGRDARQSVVDPDLRSHDHANLFLLGSGVFPTSAASNPTLTIAALALRAVEPIRRAVSGETTSSTMRPAR